MVEPVTDVEALISWLDDVGHNHSSGSVYANAATALRTLQERCKSLEALVRDAEEEVTCRLDDAACYCPNCDRSMFNVRDRLRAALKKGDQR